MLIWWYPYNWSSLEKHLAPPNSWGVHQSSKLGTCLALSERSKPYSQHKTAMHHHVFWPTIPEKKMGWCWVGRALFVAWNQLKLWFLAFDNEGIDMAWRWLELLEGENECDDQSREPTTMCVVAEIEHQTWSVECKLWEGVPEKWNHCPKKSDVVIKSITMSPAKPLKQRDGAKRSIHVTL